MVQNCVVRGCGSEWYPGSPIKYHKFPKNEVRRQVWISIVPLKTHFYGSAKICSLHFRDEDYEWNKKLLKPNAVPLIESEPQRSDKPVPVANDLTSSRTSCKPAAEEHNRHTQGTKTQCVESLRDISNYEQANNTDESSNDEKPSTSALSIQSELTASKRKIEDLQEKLIANQINLKRVESSNCTLKKKLQMSMALINKLKNRGLATKETINTERLKYANKRLRETIATLKRLLLEEKRKNRKDQRNKVYDSNLKEEPDDDQDELKTLIVKIEPADDEMSS